MVGNRKWREEQKGEQHKMNVGRFQNAFLLLLHRIIINMLFLFLASFLCCLFPATRFYQNLSSEKHLSCHPCGIPSNDLQQKPKTGCSWRWYKYWKLAKGTVVPMGDINNKASFFWYMPIEELQGSGFSQCYLICLLSDLCTFQKAERTWKGKEQKVKWEQTEKN